MPDRREEVLNKIWQSDSGFLQIAINLNSDVSLIKDAMDEYAKEMCLDLLEYMAKNSVECIDSIKGYQFYYQGQYLSKEQLFENFL